MNLATILAFISAEITAYRAQPAEARRAYAIDRCKFLYKQVIVPIDLPGPDWAIDFAVIAAIPMIVGTLHDFAVKVESGDTSFNWPELNDAPSPTEGD